MMLSQKLEWKYVADAVAAVAVAVAVAAVAAVAAAVAVIAAAFVIVAFLKQHTHKKEGVVMVVLLQLKQTF